MIIIVSIVTMILKIIILLLIIILIVVSREAHMEPSFQMCYYKLFIDFYLY